MLSFEQPNAGVVAALGLAAAAALTALLISQRGAKRCRTGDVATPQRGDDRSYLDLASKLMKELEAPAQSHFRVFCILTYWDARDEEQYVCGTNSEPAFIGGSICAERAAAAQLRLRCGWKAIRKIYLVSDSPEYLTPGCLCREYLLSLTPPATPVVMGNKARQIKTQLLGELYPHPSLYISLSREQMVRKGEELQKTPESLASELAGLMRGKEGLPTEQLVLDVCDALESDWKDELHPIRYASGVLFADGTVTVAWQHKALEYGSSFDPVTQLAPTLERKRTAGVAAVLVLQLDQYGVVHAPFASGRAFLFESDFDDTLVAVQAPTLALVRAAELVPAVPKMDELFPHSPKQRQRPGT